MSGDNSKILKLRTSIRNLCFYLGLLIEISIVLIDKSTFVNPVEGMLFRLTFFFVRCSTPDDTLFRKGMVRDLFFRYIGCDFLLCNRSE